LSKVVGARCEPGLWTTKSTKRIELIRRGEIGSNEKVLFWHTGGMPALFDQGEKFEEAG
jgi:1-aminocyclopropane-1-carboxylate deaminase/D-cysteine desulfhydrase-like pyridoxal-dependent ACC family enzyme